MLCDAILFFLKNTFYHIIYYTQTVSEVILIFFFTRKNDHATAEIMKHFQFIKYCTQTHRAKMRGFRL